MADARLAAAVDDLFGVRYQQVMTLLPPPPGSGPAAAAAAAAAAAPHACANETVREGRSFVVDLKYALPPPAAPNAAVAAATAAGMRPAVGEAGAVAAVAAMAAAAASPLGSPKPGGAGGGGPSASAAAPSFGDLLAASLKSESDTRAWFEPAAAYRWVRARRAPTHLPRVLAVNASAATGAEASAWLRRVARRQGAGVVGGGGDAASGAGGSSSEQQQQQEEDSEPWLPWAVAIDGWPSRRQLRVREGSSAAELLLGGGGNDAAWGPPEVSGAYELTAMVCHVHDARATGEPAPGTALGKGAAAAAGPGAAPSASSFLASGAGAAAAASATASASSAVAGLPSAPGHLVAVVRVQRPYLESGVLPPPPAAPGEEEEEDDDDEESSSESGEGSSGSDSADDGGEGKEAATATADAASNLAKGVAKLEVGGGGGKQAQQSKAGTVGGGAAVASAADASAAATAGPAGASWVVVNDFCITPIAAEEVRDTLGNQKLPCLLFFTRSDELARAERACERRGGGARGRQGGAEGAASAAAATTTTTSTDDDDEETRSLYALAFPSDLPPPLSADQFAALCAAPPLPRPPPRPTPPSAPPPPPPPEREPRTFVPLDMATEAPKPGTVVALDAEFVALGRAESVFSPGGRRGVSRPPRLGLARVSVVRGDGPQAGTPFIDDWVRAVEPVRDYLTRYSGILPGDLDAATTSRHLVPLKQAYLKLRYLVDAGCVFVGHGLSGDFRMCTLSVPPEQVRDTVELFCPSASHRRLRLRFLASYLLGLSIQESEGGGGGLVAAGAAARGGAAGAAPPQQQQHGHDSVEDARTALRLYREWERLRDSGELEAKIEEMYAWGKAHGWGPVVRGGAAVGD